MTGEATRCWAVDRVAKVEIDPVFALLSEVVQEDGDMRARHFAAAAAATAAAEESSAGGTRDRFSEAMPSQHLATLTGAHRVVDSGSKPAHTPVM